MKILVVHSIQEVGANASEQVITWPVSIKATAMILTALTNSGAVRWIKVITFYLIRSWTKTLSWKVMQRKKHLKCLQKTVLFTKWLATISRSVTQSASKSIRPSLSQLISQSASQSWSVSQTVSTYIHTLFVTPERAFSVANALLTSTKKMNEVYGR